MIRKILRRRYWANAPKTMPAGTFITVQGLPVYLNRPARRRAAATERTNQGWRTFL